MAIYYSYNLSIRIMSGNNLIKNILENHCKHAKTNKQKDFFSSSLFPSASVLYSLSF